MDKCKQNYETVTVVLKITVMLSMVMFMSP